MRVVIRGVAVLALLVAPVPAGAAAVDSLETGPVPEDVVDARAVAEAHGDGWWRAHARLGVFVVAGADTLLELFGRAGPAAAALRADTGARAGWVSLGLRSWRLVAGGVRASFGAGAVLGTTGSALERPHSPPRGALVRVSPSTSLWRPVRGVAVARDAGSLRLAAIAWEGAERAGAVALTLERVRWRAGVIAGQVRAGGRDDALASMALGIRGNDHAALLELGARGSAVHAVVRATAGRSPRWTAELAAGTAGTAFGAPVAASGRAGRMRLRMAVARSGRLGPVRLRVAVLSVTDREIDATRRRRRYEAQARFPLAHAALDARVRVDHDHATEWSAAHPDALRARLQRLRASAGYECAVEGVRQSLRLTVMLGPGAAQGTMIQWGAQWTGRRVRLDARVSAAALAPGQTGWFSRPGMGGRETLGVATGSVSDAALRARVRLGAVTVSGWLGAGSRRDLRGYVGLRMGD